MTGVNVHVRAGGEHYALSVEHVLEVAPVGELTPLPGAPRPFLGVRNLRGEVLPVIDLCGLLQVAGAGAPNHVVIAQSGALRAGLAVESVVGVVELPDADTTTTSAALSGAVLVGDALIGIIDVPRVFAELAGPVPS
jgi:purine-binding chemotaxis protein CheW